MSSDQSTQRDRQVMSSFRYAQELKRTIRLFGSFAVAFSFISITTGIFANYKSLLTDSGPIGIWTWPLVVGGQLLVALVFAELASRIPLTGYSYQWVTRLAGPTWGWLTGWVAVCFLVIVVPSVDHVIAQVVGHVLQIPENSIWLTVIVCGVILLQATIHIFGVRLANQINSTAVFTEMLGMVGLVLLFAVIAIRDRPTSDILFSRGLVSAEEPFLPTFLMGCLMGAYTLVGFESAANLSEETVSAETTVPRAVVWSVLVSGGVGTLFLILTALAIHDITTVTESAYPLPLIIETSLGHEMALAFFVLVIISVFACGLVIMASGSRLIYAMSRDNVFFASRLLGHVSPRLAVPVPAILAVTGLGLVAEIFSGSIQQLLLAAAVLPAVVYLATVVAYMTNRRNLPTRFGTFSLGRWGLPIAGLAACWLVLVILILTVPETFRTTACISLGLCLAGAIPWFGWIRRRVTTGKAGVASIDPDSSHSFAKKDAESPGDS